MTVGQFLQIFTAVMLPMFMAAVDQTLLASATPAIAAELGGLRDTTWIALGYLMATTITVPLYGRLGDRYGRKPVLLAAVGIFALGSAACGAAQSMLQLSLARVLQGLGGGGLIVLSQALIGELVPPRERPRFQGYFAANFTLASIAGPVLGGLVVAHGSWRWLFLVNVPLTALAAWRVGRLPASRPAAGAALDDRAGLALFALCVALALAWVSFAGHRFAWISPPSALLGGTVLALSVILLRRERAHPSPYLPAELLRVPGIAAMAATVSLFAACFFACVFFLPIYLQLGAGVGAADAGLLLMPITLGMVLGATITGRIVARTARPRPMPMAGLSLSTLALVSLGLVPPTSSTTIAALGLSCGIGFGTVMPIAQVTIQSLAGRAKLGAAAAVVSLSRALGAVLGTALFGALVYGLLHGIDLEVALRDVAAHRGEILLAFQRGFLGAAVLAATGAFMASRVPPMRL